MSSIFSSVPAVMIRNANALARGVAAVALSLLACVSQPVHAQAVPDQGPGGPILVINSPTSPFGTFYAEILRNEGFNEFAVASIANVTATTLQSYDVVVLAQMPLSSGQVTMFSNWVNAGGNLIAMRPDAGLASLLGVTVSGSPVSNGYLLVSTAPSSPGYGIVGETIQYFGAADRYTLNGATEVARLFSGVSTATANSSITLRNVGASGGQAVAFAYDLATSLVYARQGNPAWANQERDGLQPMRSDDMYFGNAVADPQPDWINLSKAAIPQADEQQRLLANLIQHVAQDRKILPRFWYFPRGEKAVVIMTGDDHANNGTQGRFDQFIQMSPAGCSVANWDCVRGTSYIFPHTPLTNTAAANYAALGFEVGLHVTTNCSNFTQSSLDTLYTEQAAEFRARFPGVPTLSTQRHHCIAWSGWATSAKVQRAHGMRLDTTYYYWPAGWVQNRPGFMTGSGMPMRFADIDGTLVDVYQAATHMTDESGQVYPYTTDELLDRALGAQGYFGAFTANMHTDVPVMADNTALVASALARSVPVVSADQMLRWLDGRNTSSFSALNRSGNTVTFTVTKAAAANGLRGYIPLRNATGSINTITRNGSSVAFTAEVVKGVEHAFFDAQSGSYIVNYQIDTTGPSVAAVDPLSGSTNVSRITSVAATMSEAINPTTVSSTNAQLRNGSGQLVVANVSYDTVSRRIQLQPSTTLDPNTTFTVTLKGGSTGIRDLFGNALTADYSWMFTTGAGPDCPCGGFATSAVPGTPAANDSGSVELGVKFTVDFNGYVAGIRFYKGAGNTGSHRGTLWTAGGQQLATALFTNETASGWQQVSFDVPVAVTAGTVYVASYHAPNGHYAADAAYFASSGVDAGPVNLLQSGVSGGNGVYAYGSATVFPTNTYNAANYWVDITFAHVAPPDTTAPLVTAVSPASGATAVAFGASLGATFSEAMNVSSLSSSSFQLRTPGGALVASSVIYDTATRTATLAPNAPLAPTTTYTATVKTGVQDLAGNALASDFSWSFTTDAPDLTPPTVTGRSPASGSADVPRAVAVRATFSEQLNAATVSGTTFELRDAAGVLVAASVSYDAASSTATLLPAAALAASHTFTAKVRGGAGGVRDLQGNALASDVNWSFTTGSTTLYSSWSPIAVPTIVEDPDTTGIELGVKFTTDLNGTIRGIRFYKGAGNTGTHVGSLWTSNGQLLGRATFAGETASGWQQVDFGAPVAVTAGTVYVASYHAPNGHYSIDAGFFAEQGVDAGPVNLLRDGVSGGNGVYVYAASSTFPSSSVEASNYWVDVVFATNIVDVTAPTITSVTPSNGSTSVPTSVALSAVFNEAVDPATVTAESFSLRTSAGALVPAAVAYDGAAKTAYLMPAAALTSSATYSATVRGGATGVRDPSGNALAADRIWTFTTGVSQYFSAWGSSATPAVAADSDSGGVELGVKFSVDVAGSITGVRFYKGAGNSGTHVGNVWSSAGQLLGRATFVAETASGWQQVNFASPVAVSPGNVYVASYYAPNGHYSVDAGYFASTGVDAGPVNLLQNGVSGGNGVYVYGAATAFPSSSYGSSNYWVDVVFAPAVVDTTAPTITGVSPANGTTGVSTVTAISVVFNEPLNSSSVTSTSLELRNASGTLIPGAVAAASSTVTLTPTAPLALSQVYTATVRGGATGVKDVAGNALAANYSWSFTTSANQTYTAWSNATSPPVPAEDDPGAVELGVKFTVDIAGAITGLRFYKGPGNTGTHVGHLWNSTGQLLATATFANETATGWQQVNFGAPVAVTAGTVYVASYHAPNGHYAASSGYFANGVDAGPVNLLQDGVSGGNGVYAYGTSGSFPTGSWNASNYWVDVIFSTSTVDTTAPTISTVLPASGGTGVSAATVVMARFSEPVNASSINGTNFQLRNASGVAVSAVVTYDSASATATLDPVANLNLAATYTAVVRGGSSGVKDPAGNALVGDYTWSFAVETTAGSCTNAPNPIVAENCLPGNPQSEWDITGVGDPTIQGFASEISVDQGQTVQFKIDNDTAAAYTIDIYRLGYYGGLGARKVATVTPTSSVNQPSCMSDPTTGLIDCGNWSVSASWAVPANATSGIYVARPKRTAGGGASHIVFIVRDDNGNSDMLFQTSDTTWQAYNSYGGNSLYVGSPAGRAYKVSYNRPFNTRIVDSGQDWLFNAEYPMLRWLEANGYDVSYTTGVDTDRRGNLLLAHDVYLSVGHDEYWSAAQRQNVEAARNSGVDLAFFSGNEVFWKTRWEPSISGSGQQYRTLVSYKETHANGFIDPQSPIWTGTWRDPRFSPPADGGKPENALTGTMFMVNGGTTAIQVPAADGKMRFWRNTSIANLAVGQVATLASSTLGYEWDADIDNGSRPAGLFRLSTTTASDVEVLQDHGSTYASGTVTHNMTLYKHTSGARVFGAGTIQWPWGLDDHHDREGGAPDIRMQQATVNLFGDMSVQPATLQPGLFPGTPSTDTIAPTSSITSPANGASPAVGNAVTISGTASDSGGGVVGGVEVSVNGGATWHPAQGRSSWTYSWTPTSTGSVNIRTRAVDDSSNLGVAGAGITVTVH